VFLHDGFGEVISSMVASLVRFVDFVGNARVRRDNIVRGVRGFRNCRGDQGGAVVGGIRVRVRGVERVVIVGEDEGPFQVIEPDLDGVVIPADRDKGEAAEGVLGQLVEGFDVEEVAVRVALADCEAHQIARVEQEIHDDLEGKDGPDVGDEVLVGLQVRRRRDFLKLHPRFFEGERGIQIPSLVGESLEERPSGVHKESEELVGLVLLVLHSDGDTTGVETESLGFHLLLLVEKVLGIVKEVRDQGQEARGEAEESLKVLRVSWAQGVTRLFKFRVIETAVVELAVGVGHGEVVDGSEVGHGVAVEGGH